MQWTLGGVILGLAGLLAITRLVAKLLFNVTPGDPIVLGSISLLLGVVSLGQLFAGTSGRENRPDDRFAR